MIAPLAVLGIAILGGVVPLWFHWGERALHRALALSTGVFLGAVFLHLLPELPGLESSAAAGSPWNHAVAVWACVLVGVLGVFLFEVLFHHEHEGDGEGHHHHESVGYAALAGLSFHSLMAGIACSVSGPGTELGAAMLVALLSHQGFEAFSLGSVLRLAGFTRRRITLLIAAYACVAPLGMLLGASINALLGEDGRHYISALAAGTFLFVSLAELVPEVFHHREELALKTGLLGAGVVAMGAVRFGGIG